MMAVTSFAGKSSVTSWTARVSPKYALSPSVRIANDAPGPATSGGSRSASVMTACVPTARHEARDDADHEHEGDEHEGARPRLRVPVVVRADGVGEDLQRKRGDRLRQLRGPELIPQGGEEERRRFAGDARHGDEHTGDDAAKSGPKHDLERRPPPWVPERQRGLAQRLRNGAHHLLRGPRDERYHHGADCRATRQRGEVTERPHEKLPGENTHDDRREPIQHVGEESHGIGELRPALFGEIQSCPDADREPNGGGDADQPVSYT